MRQLVFTTKLQSLHKLYRYAAITKTVLSIIFQPVRLFLLALLISQLSIQISAQEYVYTTIDIYGSRYSDQMMIFTIPGTSHGFDNGWDAPKLFGTSAAPQLFNIEPDGYMYYQINSLNDINNTYLGFRSGEDSIYTLVFTHELIQSAYQQLFLIDSVANRTINVYSTGTRYTFTAPLYSDIIRRFKIVTHDPSVVPVLIDSTETGCSAVSDSIISNPVMVNNDSVNGVARPKQKKDKSTSNGKKIKIGKCNRNLTIENTGEEDQCVTIYNVMTGTVKEKRVLPKSKNVTFSNLKSGTYIVNVVSSSDCFSEMVVVTN